MLLPPRDTLRKHAQSAKRTFSRTSWFGSWALVSWIIFLKQNLLAIRTTLVLIRVLALLHQMLVHALDLNYLFALPTCSEHGALLPVVDVDRLLIEIVVKRSTKVAHFIVIVEFLLFVSVLNWQLLFLVATLLRHVIFLLLTFLCWASNWFFAACGIDVCCDVYLRLLFSPTTFLTRVYLSNGAFHLLKLGRPQLSKTVAYWITHDLVKFYDTFGGNLTYVL